MSKMELKNRPMPKAVELADEVMDLELEDMPEGEEGDTDVEEVEAEAVTDLSSIPDDALIEEMKKRGLIEDEEAMEEEADVAAADMEMASVGTPDLISALKA